MAKNLNISRDHPRSRGEHFAIVQFFQPVIGSSPLTRGARLYLILLTKQPGIIPAHAGSTWGEWNNYLCQKDHPRSRGEHIKFPFHNRIHKGSSPLTRGARSTVGGTDANPGIIPAHAGSTFTVYPSLLCR